MQIMTDRLTGVEAVFEAVKAILDMEMATGGCYGYSFAVGRESDILYQAWGGDLGGPDTGPADKDTRYDLSCLTETLVGMPLTLLALENGLLSLTDPLSRYVAVPADKKEITLWHLLTHTSGIQSSFLLEPEAEHPGDALRVILRRPLGAPAGKRAKHTGLGAIALGKALETVYGMPVDQAAKRFVFDPLGMKHTGFLPTGGNIAHTDASADTGEPRIGEPHDENARFLHGVANCAGLFADVGDVCLFLAMLSREGRGRDGVFLTRESLRLAFTEHTRGMKEAWGLGIQAAGREQSFLGDLWPRGGCGQAGYTGVSLAVEPGCGLYVALLSNRVHIAKENEALHRLRRVVHNMALAAFLRGKAVDA